MEQSYKFLRFNLSDGSRRVVKVRSNCTNANAWMLATNSYPKGQRPLSLSVEEVTLKVGTRGYNAMKRLHEIMG